MKFTNAKIIRLQGEGYILISPTQWIQNIMSVAWFFFIVFLVLWFYSLSYPELFNMIKSPTKEKLPTYDDLRKSVLNRRNKSGNMLPLEKE